RPLLLGLVLHNLDHLPEGTRVAPATLYQAALGRWLQQTHTGDPEALSDEQKQTFAEALAERLWSTGEPSCSWAEIRAAAVEHLSPQLPDDLPRESALLEIAGGAFFVRTGEDRFRFAHKSLLEFFLARALVGTIALGRCEALDTEPLTAEVIAFVYELLAQRSAEIHSDPLVAAVQGWLVRRGRRDSSDERDRATVANAFALLVELGRLDRQKRSDRVSDKRWIPAGAGLRGIDLGERRLDDLDLSRVDLREASLVGAVLSGVMLAGSDLRGACLSGARLLSVTLSEAQLDDAVLTGVSSDEVIVDRASLRRADLSHSMWTRCRWAGAVLDGAHTTAWLAVPSPSDHRSSMALGRPVAPLGHQGSITAIAWSPNGSRIVSGGSDSTVRLWDARSHAQLACLRGHHSAVLVVEWSPDGERLLSASTDRTVRVWDAHSGQELACFAQHSDEVIRAAWSPDSARIASVGGADHVVRVWDTSSGESCRDLTTESRVMAVARQLGGDRLLAACVDGVVRTWDSDSGQLVERREIEPGRVLGAAWSPDRRRLLVVNDRDEACVVDAMSGEQLHRVEVPLAQVQGLWLDTFPIGWSPDGDYLLLGSGDRAWWICDAWSGQRLHTHYADQREALVAAFDPADERLLWGDADGRFGLWDLHSDLTRWWFPQRPERIRAVAWNADGSRISSCSRDGSIASSELRSGQTEVYLSMTLGSHTVQTAVWSPDGSLLLDIGTDGNAQILAANGAPVCRLHTDSEMVTAGAWRPDGQQVVTGDGNGTLGLWDIHTGQAIGYARTLCSAISALAWSPDGNSILIGDVEGRLTLWTQDVSGALEHQLSDHKRATLALAWNPNNRHFVASYDDETVEVWDVGERTRLYSLDHRATVLAITWSSDGAWLASGTRDGSVAIWATGTGQLVQQLHSHTGAVHSISWSPDSTRLLSGSDDGTVCLWHARQGLLAVFQLFQMGAIGAMTTTAAGLCRPEIPPPAQLALAVARPERPRSLLFRPLYWDPNAPMSALESALYRPDLLPQALAGDIDADRAAMAAVADELGFSADASWDGRVTFAGASAATGSNSPPPPDPNLAVRMLEQLLIERFGPLPDRAADRLAHASSADIERWTARFLSAQSLDDVLE
ncbi:MAG: pentapeptide repeat-containing protein, partial [Myxococcota bacterium]